MAKAPKTISILASDELADLPEFRELVAKGHTVVPFCKFVFADGIVTLDDFDLIVGKQCCMYQEGMAKYLVDMLKGARSRKYGPTQLGLEV